MSDARTQIVADGYDTIGETFAEWRESIVADPRRDWKRRLASRLPDGARDAGFAIELDELVTVEEPEGPARFQWVFATR